MLNPPVKIENLRLIAVDDFARTTQPVFQKLAVWIRCGKQILMIGLLLFGRPVEIAAVQRLFDIAVEVFAVSHKPVMLCAMGGGTEYHAFFREGSFQFSDDVPAWPHLCGIVD